MRIFISDIKEKYLVTVITFYIIIFSYTGNLSNCWSTRITKNISKLTITKITFLSRLVKTCYHSFWPKYRIFVFRWIPVLREVTLLYCLPKECVVISPYKKFSSWNPGKFTKKVNFFLSLILKKRHTVKWSYS